MARTYFRICGNDLCKQGFNAKRHDTIYCCHPCRVDHQKRTVKPPSKKTIQRKCGVRCASKKYLISGL